jgi:hypothetical protein
VDNEFNARCTRGSHVAQTNCYRLEGVSHEEVPLTEQSAKRATATKRSSVMEGLLPNTSFDISEPGFHRSKVRQSRRDYRLWKKRLLWE